MHDARSHPIVPRAALRGAAVLLTGTMIFVAVSQWTGFGQLTTPTTGQIVQQRALTFVPRPDGTMAVQAADAAEPIAILPPGNEGFVRGVLRAVNRKRMRLGIEGVVTMELTHWADGRLSLRDTATGELISLRSFGPDNAKAFARFLPAGSTQP